MYLLKIIFIRKRFFSQSRDSSIKEGVLTWRGETAVASNNFLFSLVHGVNLFNNPICQEKNKENEYTFLIVVKSSKVGNCSY